MNNLIKEIRETLDYGEPAQLEFIASREDYVNQNHVAVYEREEIAKSSLVVGAIMGGGKALALRDCFFCIPEKDYKYFRVKDQSPAVDGSREGYEMKDRIKEMLERGERVVLECVDIKGAERIEEISGYREGIMTSEIVVHSIGRDGELIIGDDSDEDLFIAEEEFKYFKIKEPEYTFNDLIDVAVKAYKDGVLSNVDLRDNEIFLTGLGVIDKNRNHVFQSAVNDIKLLYTETFVIERESDIKKTKEGASVELANGNVFIINKSKHESLAMKDGSRATGLTFKDSNNFWITYSLFELKGATVTQKRGDS